jgi:hypothetical protein
MLILAPALIIALAVVSADDAAAGLFGKKQDTEQRAKAWRFDLLPTMSFTKGKISQDVVAGWAIDDLRVQLAPQCSIVDQDGQKADLYDGQNVIIMGPRAGNTIVAWQVRLMPRDVNGQLRSDTNDIVRSESDPTVGVGTGPN